MDDNGRLGEYETSRGFKLALMDEGDVTMKSMMDQERKTIMKTIWFQRAISVPWGYLIYAFAAAALRFFGILGVVFLNVV